MADHMYKPHEVPKGERWQYFKDYYLVKSICIALGVIALISLLKTTVFAPKPDVSMLIAHTTYIDNVIWEEATAAFQTLPLDLNEDGQILIDAGPIHIDPNMEKTDPEMYMASQNKLMASLATAEYALQVVDDALFESLSRDELIGTYAELPDAMGHNPEEIVKIPLQELAPFKTVENVPDGLYMTLRPKNAMQIGNSKKKLAHYDQQLKVLMIMMQQ